MEKRRICIIDHDTHSAYFEDIDVNVLEEKYNGDEQAYIDDNYDLTDYSWDWITDVIYYDEDGDTLEVEMPTKHE